MEAVLKTALTTCAPVLDAGAKASTPEDNAKAADRAHKECDPVIDGAMEKIVKFSGDTVTRVAKQRQLVSAEASGPIRNVIVAFGSMRESELVDPHSGDTCDYRQKNWRDTLALSGLDGL